MTQDMIPHPCQKLVSPSDHTSSYGAELHEKPCLSNFGWPGIDSLAQVVGCPIQIESGQEEEKRQEINPHKDQE